MNENGASQQNDLQNVSDVFNEGLDIYNRICSTNEPANSPNVQMDVKTAMKKFVEATRMVSMADVFSKNEGVEEIATNDLRYFLLPALLGSLTLKLTSGDRKNIVNTAEIYFKDFLQRTNEYGLSNYKFSESDAKDSEEKKTASEFEQLAEAVNTRANKIQRFKEQKELKSHLENLKKNVENEHCDEEIKRNYFLTMIKVFINEVIDELSSIEMEKPILEHMAKMTKEDRTKPKREPPPPLKPIIITRDEFQKAVYGAGYPSLPTMTVQEFYDKKVAEGDFPDPSKKKDGSMSMQEAALAGISLNDEKEAIDTENKEELDDEEYIARMRAKDEFKDDHRRGWGNRMNRS